MGASHLSAPVTATYWRLFLMQRVVVTIASVYSADKVKNRIHLSLGQEAVAARTWSRSELKRPRSGVHL
jgi:hypothetical protein